MTRGIMLASTIAISTFVLAASAAKPPEEPRPAQPRQVPSQATASPAWIVGLNAGISSVSSPFPGQLTARTPFAGLQLEYALFDHLWAIGSVSGNVDYGAGEVLGEPVEMVDGALTASIGLRPVFNPEGPVVFSALALVGAGAARSTFFEAALAETAQAAHMSGLSMTVNLGAAAETWLTPHLGVRLSSMFVGARADQFWIDRPEQDEREQEKARQSFTAGIDIAPALSVHLRF